MRFLFFYILFVTFGATAQCVNSAQIDSTVMCPMVFDPVCGCDGVTYSNSCVAFYVGGVTAWTTGECGSVNSCINTAQIDSTIVCLTQFDPVCGCDSVTYSNSCVAENYAGVTTWTPGPCSAQIQMADSCSNLAGINFGLCGQFLGYGLINDICSPISGCGTVVGNIDYSTALVESLESCQIRCENISEAPACSDLSNVDFGACAMPLGYGLIDNQCQMISGCSTISGTIDYASSLYSTANSCQLCISGSVTSLSNFIKVYPTLMNSHLVLEVNEDFSVAEFQMVNNIGKKVLSGAINDTFNVISVDRLSPGVYTLILNHETKLHYRLIKQ
jgi:hypothetical protein